MREGKKEQWDDYHAARSIAHLLGAEPNDDLALDGALALWLALRPPRD